MMKVPLIPQVLDLSGTGFELLGDTSNAIAGIGDTISSFFGGNGGKGFRVILYGALGLSVGYLMYRGYKMINK
jgi:hypothetical protein